MRNRYEFEYPTSQDIQNAALWCSTHNRCEHKNGAMACPFYNKISSCTSVFATELLRQVSEIDKLKREKEEVK